MPIGWCFMHRADLTTNAHFVLSVGPPAVGITRYSIPNAPGLHTYIYLRFIHLSQMVASWPVGLVRYRDRQRKSEAQPIATTSPPWHVGCRSPIACLFGKSSQFSLKQTQASFRHRQRVAAGGAMPDFVFDVLRVCFGDSQNAVDSVFLGSQGGQDEMREKWTIDTRSFSMAKAHPPPKSSS